MFVSVVGFVLPLQSGDLVGSSWQSLGIASSWDMCWLEGKDVSGDEFVVTPCRF